MSDLARRRVEPEILDELAPVDPRAIASRRDLYRVNALMTHRGILVNLMRRHLATPPKRILEIGTGDGQFMLSVARRLAKHWGDDVEVLLLDRQALVSDETLGGFRHIGWRAETVTADVFEWTKTAAFERFDAVTANLFLHHFREPDLSRLFGALGRLSPLLLATEPLRGGFPLFASRLLWAIGANDVTRNDAPASVRAGFAGRELSELWPDAENWQLEEGRRGLFTQAFAARRIGP